MSTAITAPSITERSVDVWGDQITIRVKVAGTGAPLLYLHPAAGLAWDRFLSHLADRYTVYAPEFPGTSSGDPYATRVVDQLSDIVLIYEELVRKLELNTPVAVGQSFGGMLAAELAAAYPALLSKLVLLDPIGLWRDDAPVANWMATAPEDMPTLLFNDPQSQAAQAMLSLPDDPEVARAITAAMVWAFGCTGKFVWPIPDRGLRRRLHRITAPALVVWGRQDRLVSVVYADEWARHLRDVRVHIIESCGHIPQMEKLDETASAVDEFLAQH